jgi:hypothetical protein
MKGVPPKHTQFKKGQTGNPNGRPPKTLTVINAKLKAEGHEAVTASAIWEAFSILLGLPESKIKEIVMDTENPRMLRLAGETMLSGDGWDIIEKMLDRAHGKAKQSIDVTTQGEKITQQIDLSKLTDDELRTIAELQRKSGIGEA